MEIPSDLLYTIEHEWVRLKDNRAIVGITDFAQGQLGDVVFVELPAEETELTSGKALGVVESVKTVSDIYAPVSGVVIAVNRSLEDVPENVHLDAYGDGWFFALKPADVTELEELMDAVAYRELAESED